MKKYTFLLVCFLVLFSASIIHAQQGFTGPTQFGFPGQQVVMQQGFAGSVMPLTVSHVQAFPDKAAAILNGNIVAHLGSDRYLFRDATGEIILKIPHNRWWGLSVGPSDLIEIGGELKRDKRTGMINYFDAKSIRRAS